MPKTQRLSRYYKVLSNSTNYSKRCKRDLNFEARTADDERKQDIQVDLEEIEVELANLKLRQQELTEYADTLEAEQKAQVEKQQQARLEADRAFLATFEEQIGDSLCRFGSGLRALPRDEHISFVLKNFEVGDKRQAQDRVYVFNQVNIRECVQEKISADKLLEQAVVYIFNRLSGSSVCGFLYHKRL